MELPTLTHPERLLWLAPVALVLWRLAQPPRPNAPLFTAHSAQWQLALQHVRRRPPRFRALRWLLALLASAMLALAAADPALADDSGATDLVFVIDASASAGAVGPDGLSALDRAVVRARQAALRVPSHIQVRSVIGRSGHVERLAGEAARLLADPGGAGGSLPAPLGAMAEALAGDRTLVWTFGDGQGTAGAPPPTGAWTSVGHTLPNAALRQVELRDDWPLASIVLRAQVASCWDEPLRGEVRIDGAVLQPVSQPLEVGARESKPIEFLVQRATAGGRIRMLWTCESDALAADDVAEFESPPLPLTRIVVQADESGSSFADAAGRSLADAVGGSVVEPVPGQAVGFLIVEGGSGSSSLEPGPMVSFGHSIAGAQAWPSPILVDWDRADPVLSGLDLSDLEMSHALRGALPAGRTLMMGQLPDGSLAPLAVVQEGPQGKAYRFAFRLQDSNLGLLAAFPQLVLRCYEQSQPGPLRIRRIDNEVDASESDLTMLAEEVDRPPIQFADPPSDLAAWCAAIALGLLALRSGVR